MTRDSSKTPAVAYAVPWFMARTSMPNWTIARYADPVEMRATDIAPVRTSLRERRVGTVVTGNVRSAGATGISP